MESKPFAKHLDWQADDGPEDDFTATGTRRMPRPTDTITEEVLGDADDDKRNLSVLGRSLIFKGELTAEEDLLIQGRVEGSIAHRAKNLTIGAHGDVEADIVAQHVIVQGKVHGDIRASESIVVEPSARVRGNMYAPRIGLKDGAKFKGGIDMDFDLNEDTSSKSAKSGSSNSSAGSSSSKKSSSSKASGAKSDDEKLSDSKVDDLLD